MSGSEVKYSVNQQLLSNEDGGGRRTRGPGLSLQVGQTDGPGHTERLKGPEERVGGGLDHAVLQGRPTVLLFSASSSLFSTRLWAPGPGGTPGTPRGAWLTPAGAA